MFSGAIGIDLGTSKCCVGVVRDGKVEILENERGNKTTPSYVAFTDTERLVGEDAKDQATLNPANTVFGVKRIIGRQMTDALMDDIINKMPYAIMNRSEDGIRIRVSYKGAEEFLSPQQISAMLLSKMKDLVELHRVKEEAVITEPGSFSSAVISVPASFSNAQRQATKDAAAIAGLKVLALINEPTAAAIAYQANRKETNKENVAVVNFGAGNLDIAIATLDGGVVSVSALCGSSAIGGNDIDEVLMKSAGSKFEIIQKLKLIESSTMTNSLRSCCEKLKKKLTLLPNAHEKIDCYGNLLTVTLSREDLNAVILSKIHSLLMNCVCQAKEVSGLNNYSIDRVVLVGGSSRIPEFQNLICGSFGERSLDTSVNPDEAVARGAALYADHLINEDSRIKYGYSPKCGQLAVKDSVPNSFCFSSVGDSNIEHVFQQHSNTTFPQERKFLVNTYSPFNEKTLAQTFELYEEFSGQKNPHRLIGTFCLDEFHQSARQNGVTFSIDRCGIVNATVELGKNKVIPIVVKTYSDTLDQVKLQNAIEREQQFRKDDQDERERVEAMSGLEALSFRLYSAMGDCKAKELLTEVVKQISYKAKESIQWLFFNNTASEAEYVKRQNKLKALEKYLKSNWKHYQKREKVRLAAVASLESYCSSLKSSVVTSMDDESELVAALGEQLEEVSEGLKSSERPSKEDCDDRTKRMKKVQGEIEGRLETERQEDERRAAGDVLHE